MRTARWWLVGLMVMAWAVAAPVRGQPAPFIPYEAPSGTAISLYKFKECREGTDLQKPCATDADCAGSVTAGRCQTVGAQGVVPLLPDSLVHDTVQIRCAGLATPVALPSTWVPAQWVRISSAPGNRRAYVGYAGVDTSTGQFIDGGTLSFGMWTVGLDASSVFVLCEIGDLVAVATP